MIAVTGTVVGDVELGQRLSSAGPALLARLQRVVQSCGLLVLGTAKEKLSDDVLHVRSGRLRRSLHEQTTATSDTVESTVGTDVVYARAQELGFTGTEVVRAHTRTTKRAIAQVQAFTRRMNIPAHPFLSTSLAERRAEILERLAQGLAEPG